MVDYTDGAWTYTLLRIEETTYADVIDYSVFTGGTVVNIPSELGGYPIHFSGSPFTYNTEITEVTFPDTLGYIPSSFFEGCTALSKVTIGESVTEIGSAAFFGAYNLTEIIFRGEQPATIGQNAFSLGTSSSYQEKGGNTVALVKSPGDWASSVLDVYKGSYTTLVYEDSDVDPGTVVQYKYLQYDGSKIQVDSAVRDGEGAKIHTNYLKKNSFWAHEYTLGVSITGTISTILNVPQNVTPRTVQVFEGGGATYTLIQTDAVLSVANGGTWSCTVTKPSLGYSANWIVRVIGWGDVF